MTTILATIEGCPITLESAPEKVSYLAKSAIDGDGAGPRHGDPCYQPDTALHVNGHPLNADQDRYIVIPPVVRRRTRGIVLGCRATITHTVTGLKTEAVVGDVGPAAKLGEISIAATRAIGLDPSPTHGGISAHVIYYEIFPGQAAPGYQIQPA